MEAWRLYSVLVLSALFFVSELVASQLCESVILLMDSYHMLYNFLSLVLLVVSLRASKKKTSKNTFGWARLEILGILVNLLFFAALCFAVIIEGIQELIHQKHSMVNSRYPYLVLIFGSLRFILNIFALALIKGYTCHQNSLLRIRSEEVLNGKQDGNNHKLIYTKQNDCDNILMTDILRDNSGCLLLLCYGLLDYCLNRRVPPYVDFVFSLLAISILFLTSYQFVQESSLILLQTIPQHLNMEALKNRLIKEFPAILNIHDIHIWQLNSSQTIATVHVVLASIPVYVRIANQLGNFFKKEGINMVTIQPEFCEGYSSWKKVECILRCSPVYNCGTLTCCGHLLRNKVNSNKQSAPPMTQVFTINNVEELSKDSYDIPKLDISDLQSAIF
ncbi:zinc transporter 1-like [Centruroides sculpturatus]|uniref:zinc transporter 1-like n=1 Tax=Centruroides sculpturatus TaxID=218467 RepID=UPI000C6E614B|nr:zinc transporter 1-like [Centruroides sculpturatus]XP_023229835.1 zinc transporter 1-like [Centruroides sculpturatus]XP_023229836.1 zinc transporter 1-like [Centruroides sculpturatus]XP_023229837.1 zinc transporter 1-like [Centruroides sculpturatus]XP_023229838.1 zinc transporter 1-like [Centruroides sculpturatus]